MGQLTNAGRRQIRIASIRHEECGLQRGIDLFDHERPLKFVFKITERTKSANQKMAILLRCVFIQKTIKSIHFDIGNVFGRLTKHIQPFFRSKHIMLGRV